MTDHCPTCGAAVRIEACGVTHYMVPTDAERVRELEAELRDVLDYAQDYAAINDERPPCLESAKKLLEQKQ